MIEPSGHSGGPTRLRSSVVALTLLSVGVLIFTWARTTPLSNDGVQYLESARQLLGGRGYSTGIIYFDEQYRTGSIPAPQTVWPPATAAAIAGLAAAGVDLEDAGRLLARLAFVFVAPLTFLVAFRLTGSRPAAWAAALWQISLGELWMYLATPNSELPFLATSLGALAAVPTEAPNGARRWTLVFFLAAVATLFRYAGLFLIGAMGLVWLHQQIMTWRRHRKVSWAQLGSPLLGVAIVLALLARNQAITGDFRGGNTVVVHQPIIGLLVETIRSGIDVLAGATRSDFAPIGLGSLVAGLGLIGLALVVGLGVMALRRGTEPGPGRWYAGVLIFYLAIYLVAVIVTASRTMLTYGARYLLPIVPVAICLVVWAAAGPRKRVEGP